MGVGVILKNNKGEFLLQHRDNKKGIKHPNKWHIFGGGIKKGEKPINAAIREIKEELCLKLDKTKLKLVRKFHPKTKTHYIYEYNYPVELKQLKLQEGQGMGFFSKEELSTKKDLVSSLGTLLGFTKVL